MLTKELRQLTKIIIDNFLIKIFEAKKLSSKHPNYGKRFILYKYDNVNNCFILDIDTLNKSLIWDDSIFWILKLYQINDGYLHYLYDNVDFSKPIKFPDQYLSKYQIKNNSANAQSIIRKFDSTTKKSDQFIFEQSLFLGYIPVSKDKEYMLKLVQRIYKVDSKVIAGEILYKIIK